MAGAVPAAGSTPEQLQAKIEDALAGAPAFVGTYTLTTSSAGLTCTDSASFAVSGTTLSIGATDVTGVRTYNICVTGTDSHFTNSPYTQQIALTGAAPAATITSVSLAPSSFTAQTGNHGRGAGLIGAIDAMDRQRQADHLGNDHRTARPGLDRTLVVSRTGDFHLLHQVVVDERTFLE